MTIIPLVPGDPVYTKTEVDGLLSALQRRIEALEGAAPPPNPEPTPTPTLPLSSNKVTFGAAVQRIAPQTHAQAVELFGQKAGFLPVIDHEFYGSEDVWPTADHLPFDGQIPMITWEPFGLRLDQIVSGSKDLYLTSRASACKARGGPILLRPMHEMNGYWYPWSGAQNGKNTEAAALYREAWKRIHDIFKTAKASNVFFVWCINADSVPSREAAPWNAPENYYPGDDFVDYIGIDGYNFGDGNGQRAPAAIFNSAYLQFNSYNKPMIICETSSADNVLGAAAPAGTVPWTNMDKPKWMQEFSNWLNGAPLVDGVVWFNYSKEQAWQIDSTPASLAAFRALITNWVKL